MKNKTINQELDDVFIAFRQNMTTSLLREAKYSGLSLSHFEIIMHVVHHKEVTMKDISSLLHITPPSASVLIDTLVKKHLVKRVPSDKDRRITYIILDKESSKLIKSIHNKKMSIFKKMLSKISDKDKKELIRILNTCIK